MRWTALPAQLQPRAICTWGPALHNSRVARRRGVCKLMLLLAITLHCQCVLQPPSLREGPNTYLCDKLDFFSFTTNQQATKRSQKRLQVTQL